MEIKDFEHAFGVNKINENLIPVLRQIADDLIRAFIKEFDGTDKESVIKIKISYKIGD